MWAKSKGIEIWLVKTFLFQTASPAVHLTHAHCRMYFCVVIPIWKKCTFLIKDYIYREKKMNVVLQTHAQCNGDTCAHSRSKKILKSTVLFLGLWWTRCKWMSVTTFATFKTALKTGLPQFLHSHCPQNKPTFHHLRAFWHSKFLNWMWKSFYQSICTVNNL